MGKRRVNFQRCWLPVSRIGLHRRGVERVNCGPKLLDLGEKGVYSSYTFFAIEQMRLGEGHVEKEDAMKIDPWNVQQLVDLCGYLTGLGVTETIIPLPALTEYQQYLDRMRWVAEEIMPNVL